MPIKNIVRNQRTSWKKRQFARKLRRNMTPAERKLGDFYCLQADLVIEVDGPIHVRQKAADQRREEVVKTKGLRVMRFKNEEIKSDLDIVCKRKSALLRGTP